ncbi:P-type ATPase [Candidatus Scalindua japonica]|uniref:P-type ATPase n=1 Tax=Candidatus Scalindua japonica TaxID=1284222 RepID=A0A286TT81_9BACT|nr:heavy metal-associated domain-containing protein [Candidatus Scalindua japonica]GAX59086.1 P-type ATPase [Candidatus Scalindua japonica]
MLTNKYLSLGYVSIFAIILGLAINTTCVNTAQATDHKKIEFKVKGMGCEHCAKAIETIVTQCSGVMGCAVSYKDGKATVEIEAGKLKEVIETLEHAGFEIPPGDIEEMY